MILTPRKAVSALLLGCAACHARTATFGPNPERTAADCAAVIAGVRGDTSVFTAPRPRNRVVVIPPQPPPPSVRGRTATLWIPVDEHGRVDADKVRVTGIPDKAYVRELQIGARDAKWLPAVKDGCWVPGWGYMTYLFPRATLTVSAADTAQAAAVAAQRMSEHAQSGWPLTEIRRTREWFTDGLYELLVADQTDPGGIGYVNFDPFTDAEDDVGPPRYEGVTFVADTFKVGFSRKGYNEVLRIQLAMRYVNGAWRIANFLYPSHPRCHRDLARAMKDYASRQIPDSTSCDY
jgi:hypothetical protein